MRTFFKLTKVDEVKKQVFGVAAEEALDKSSEIMDYASSKPNFEAWSGAIAKVTDGKSLGNVRVMHTSKAAGKLIDLNFDDAAKTVAVGVQVVDDDEWKKVAEGVYTGFSVGGSYAKIWKDADGARRYTAMPTEISLVDNPCMYGANFECIKAAGTELRKFKGGARTVLAKSMYDVADLAMCLASLNSIRQWTMFEAQAEGDGSSVPARLLAAVENLSEILVDMASEESSELTMADSLYQTAKTEVAKLVKKAPVTTGEENTVITEQDRNELVAALNKSVSEGPLAKLASEMTDLRKAVEASNAKSAELEKGVEGALKVVGELAKAFSTASAPAKGNVAVTKAADGAATSQTETPKDDVQSLIKSAWSQPQSVDKRGAVA